MTSCTLVCMWMTLSVACSAECPDLQQLLLIIISRKFNNNNYAISVKAEAHVMVLHTTRKFVTATPTSVTHTDGHIKSKCIDVLHLNIRMFTSPMVPTIATPMHSAQLCKHQYVCTKST